MSALSFGAWVTFGKQVDVDLATDMMKTAYDAGVNFFDNAEIYGRGVAEEVMGGALKRLGWRRTATSFQARSCGASLKDRGRLNGAYTVNM